MKKLLVVDDDESLRRLMQLELNETYNIIATGEPEQGLALALEHRPEAILLDLRMPNYSGYELCQTFTSFSLTQKIPVIIVSGEAGAQTKEYCKQLGASGYFEKPVDFEALKACLGEIAKPQQHVSRNEVRVRLRVPLKLCGKDANGKGFEQAAATENVSLNGFFCTCSADIPLHSIVDVYMAKSGDAYVGKAEIIQSDSNSAPLRRYGCRFTDKSGDWVLR
jgi:CheY-like chemotaxis protein